MDMNIKTQKENEERVAEEYLSSLSDLNCNSKPLINMLTMLAEENIEYAAVIVKVVEQHIAKVPPDIKLPLLYLIDSIVKNVKSTYIHLFSQCIVNIFCDVFEKVNEKVRERMYALRQTWNEVFPSQKLYALDVKVKRIDNNWPITAKQAQPSIHVNPNFLKTVSAVQSGDVEEILQAKTRELLVLKKRKLELELEATKKSLEEQEKQLCKTADGVIPAVDQIADTNSLNNLRIQGVPSTQIVPPALMTTHMRSQGTPTVLVSGAVSPALYHHSFRNPRTQVQQHVVPGMIGVGPQNYPPAGNTGKPKVHPVNPVLLNTVKQRDPRLARHQQLQETAARNNLNTTEETKRDSKPSSPYRNGNSKNGRSVNESCGSFGGGSGELSSENKSTARHSSSESQRKSGSPRDKEKYRNRSASKSSTTSSSSAGSNSTERQKNSSSSSNRNKSGRKCDKDAFEIASLSTAFKRKSPSASDSSSKKKESKRKAYSHLTSSKRRSRSRSPTNISIESVKDETRNMSVSPKKHHKSYTTDSEHEEEDKNVSKNITKNLESKNIEIVAGSMAIAAKKDTDLRRFPSSYTPELEQVVASEAPNEFTTVATPSPKVSFKIHKLFNKLEKSTERPATVAVDSEMPKTSLVIADSDKKCNDAIMDTLKPSTFKVLVESATVAVNDDKKRSQNNADDEEPLAKKSKSTKFDALFGDEDVDLRTVMPPQIMVSQQHKSVGSPTPPPPPVITGEPNVENWNNLKTVKASASASNTSKTTPSKTSTLEDVRAKLAKATKYNKFSKPEKHTNEFAQRLKLSELNVNDDSQEANDEKIRTIVAQAQELLESKSINQDQYKNLMQKVMSINEANKLKEAKRRESFNNYGPRSKPSLDEENAAAAREAVLKKRIPKLIKNQGLPCEDSPEANFGSTNSNKSPIYDERSHSSNDFEMDGVKAKLSKEKKPKASKWSDKTDSTNTCAPGHPSLSKGWLKASAGKPHHGPGGFRPTVPGPPQMPWQLNPNLPPPVPFINPIPLPSMPTPIPIPPSIPKPCNSIDNPQADLVRTITIDGLSKEIRIYDQVAIVFMELDQPREIGFQAGQRSIIIDDDPPITLQFNDSYKIFAINGDPHRLRFGFPSRELYIDEHWYEIYFGGPPVSVPIKNKLHILKAEGPPPQVNIGALRRDLVVGKINMIVDAHVVIPLFLDAKPQRFKLAENEHTVQFADNLQTVLLDGEAAKVEYGGLPKSYTLSGISYFIRFGALPQGVVAGKIKIKDMIYVKTEPTETSTISEAQLSASSSSIVIEERSDEHVKVQDQSSSGESQAQVVSPSETGSSDIPIFSSTALNNINIDELFQKLVSSGILSGSTAPNKIPATGILPSAAITEDPPQPVATRPIDLSKTETIKTRQASIIEFLFSGMQCSSCGVRFPPEQTIKYSQHLDWHFRQNRRERDLSRKAHSRKWYYDLTDWVQYEEIEDLEEREKNFFETQQNDIELNDDASNQRWPNSPVLSCPAMPEDVDRACDMCHEKFEQFYNEDLEEWHLRSALRVNDKIYHPLCYEDYKAALNSSKVKEKTEVTAKEDSDTADIVIKIEGDEKAEQYSKVEGAKEDEDDDVIVLPNEEPSVTEIDDDDEYVPENITNDVVKAKDEDNSVIDATGSDVEIQEPHIPFTDLDTYEEKEASELDESSQMSFLNVKIKEEPKDDEDEDDGFEDVGTVVIPPDEEISIQSSEETQTHTIASTASGPSNSERPPSSASNEQVESVESAEVSPAVITATDLSTSVDGILETEDEINLSTIGPSPAVPLASLVNKIKINIAKNNTSANSSSSNNNSSSIVTLAGSTPSVVPIVSAADSGLKEENSSVHENQEHGNITALSVVSTIPVLCGGGTSNVRTTVSTTSSAKNPTNDGSNVSTISVIGSYGNTSTVGRYYPQPNSVASTAPRPLTPNDDIKYQLKPSLQNVALTKTKRIQCGVETSGLCSIM